MTFREDEARHRAGYCADNFATLRHMAVNLVKHAPARRVSMRNARLMAGWDTNALVRIVAGSSSRMGLP